MRFTNGKWVVNPKAKSIVLLPNGMTVEVWKINTQSTEEAEANARLIASAPEILESLKKIIAIQFNSTASLAELNSQIKNAIPIINKATGEQL